MEENLHLDKGEGLRFNEGKLRHDLIDPVAINELARVFTKGAEKYIPRNWEKGMAWSKMLASLKRHESAWERGEDYDPETGLLHMAQVAWNAMALVSYYKMYPQGDDRQHKYLFTKKIGVDIDGVLADFVGPILEMTGKKDHTVYHWNDPLLMNQFEKVKKDPEFWLNLPALMKREDMPFEPHCYITSRSIDTQVTQDWLDKHLFPKAPIYSIGIGESKVEVAKQSGIDIMVDDYYKNFVELNKAGILTYLYDAPWNKKHDVGYKRIYSLKELV